jgi:hypothetical protein
MPVKPFDFKSAYARFDEINKTRALTRSEEDALEKLVEREKRHKSDKKAYERDPTGRRHMTNTWRLRNPEAYKRQLERKNAKRNAIREQDKEHHR